MQLSKWISWVTSYEAHWKKDTSWLKLDYMGKETKSPTKWNICWVEERNLKQGTMHILCDSLFEFKLEMIIYQNPFSKLWTYSAEMINKVLHSLEKNKHNFYSNKRISNPIKLMRSAKTKGLAVSSYQGISI